MNYLLKDLRSRVETLIEEQGEEAPCAAWIYTQYDCYEKDEDGFPSVEHYVTDPAVLEITFNEVGEIDYIYEVIQDCVDECLEEALKYQ